MLGWEKAGGGSGGLLEYEHEIYGSDELFFFEDLLESSVPIAGGSNEARDGDEVGLVEVDGAVVVDLNGGGSTSQMEIWTEE